MSGVAFIKAFPENLRFPNLRKNCLLKGDACQYFWLVRPLIGF